MVGETHKHRWSEQLRDKEAYRPPDIVADEGDPRAVWQQFCTEARIRHDGQLSVPPALQEELF
jgi:hypothetical protein